MSIVVGYCVDCRLVLYSARRCPSCSGMESVHELLIPTVERAKVHVDVDITAIGKAIDAEILRQKKARV